MMLASAQTRAAVPEPRVGWNVIPLQLADLDQLMVIENTVFPSPWSRESYVDMLDVDTVRALAVKEGKTLIGYMLYQWWGEEMELHAIAVHPSWQRSGVGRYLLEQLFAEADRVNVHRIFLLVRPSNVAARALYEGFDFHTVGKRKRYYEDNGEDALVLCCHRSRA